MNATEAMNEIQQHMDHLTSGDGPVGPGHPDTITAATDVNEGKPQGDLYLVVQGSLPRGYVEVKQLTEKHLQLVPGNTVGAKHCLDSVDGIRMWLPKDFGPDYEELLGPFIQSDREFVVLHPNHGDITVESGVCPVGSDRYLGCGYQREWDAEQARERRNAD